MKLFQLIAQAERKLAEATAKLAGAVPQQELPRAQGRAASKRTRRGRPPTAIDYVPPAPAGAGPVAGSPAAATAAGSATTAAVNPGQSPGPTAAPQPDSAWTGYAAVLAANAGAGSVAANPGGVPGASAQAQPAAEPPGLGCPVGLGIPLQVWKPCHIRRT